MVKFLTGLASAVSVVYQEPGLADEVVMVLGDGPRSQKHARLQRSWIAS
jgi:hypothetical protein